MSLQEGVDIRSQELLTKEKRKVAEKGDIGGSMGDQDTTEPMGERQEIASGSAEEEQTGPEEIVEVDVPLVRKGRRLVKVGKTESVQERVAAESTGPRREGANQEVIEPGE